MRTLKIRAGGTEVKNSILSGVQTTKETKAFEPDPFNEDDDDFELSQDEDLNSLEDLELDDDDDY